MVETNKANIKSVAANSATQTQGVRVVLVQKALHRIVVLIEDNQELAFMLKEELHCLWRKLFFKRGKGDSVDATQNQHKVFRSGVHRVLLFFGTITRSEVLVRIVGIMPAVLTLNLDSFGSTKHQISPHLFVYGTIT